MVIVCSAARWQPASRRQLTAQLLLWLQDVAAGWAAVFSSPQHPKQCQSQLAGLHLRAAGLESGKQ
jgi:hypothetical protein